MPKLTPLPNWAGQAAYIIGGGPSLRRFDFSSLRGRNTIGCNQAFKLGEPVCKIVTFGDDCFWVTFKNELEQFPGWVASSLRVGNPLPWVKWFPRKDQGLASPESGQLGWINNTGCQAVNLALLCGAAKVYLLGFDMNMGETPKQTHWHDWRLQEPTAAHYEKFAGGFATIAKELPEVFPGTEIINVTDGSSSLFCFPRFDYDEAGLAGAFAEETQEAAV